MNIWPTKSRPKSAEPIDPDALEQKRQRVMRETEHHLKVNPTLAEYHQKLTKLLEVRSNSDDQFINWITGLNTAAMYLALNSLDIPNTALRVIILLSATFSFLGLLSSVFYKVFANVRFAALQAEVTILKTLSDGHSIKVQIATLTNSGKPVTDADKQRLLQNIDETLDFLDPQKLAIYSVPVQQQALRMIYAYRFAISFFITGITLLMLRYGIGFFTRPLTLDL